MQRNHLSLWISSIILLKHLNYLILIKNAFYSMTEIFTQMLSKVVNKFTVPVVKMEMKVTTMKKRTKIMSILIWNQRKVDRYINQLAVCKFRALWNRVSKQGWRPKARSVHSPFTLVTRWVKIGLLPVNHSIGDNMKLVIQNRISHYHALTKINLGATTYKASLVGGALTPRQAYFYNLQFKAPPFTSQSWVIIQYRIILLYNSHFLANSSHYSWLILNY